MFRDALELIQEERNRGTGPTIKEIQSKIAEIIGKTLSPVTIGQYLNGKNKAQFERADWICMASGISLGCYVKQKPLPGILTIINSHKDAINLWKKLRAEYILQVAHEIESHDEVQTLTFAHFLNYLEVDTTKQSITVSHKGKKLFTKNV